MLEHEHYEVNRCETVRRYVCHAIQKGCSVGYISWYYMISPATIYKILNGEIVYLCPTIYKHMLKLWSALELTKGDKKNVA